MPRMMTSPSTSTAGMPNSKSGDEMSIEAMRLEAGSLKAKLDEERNKVNDVKLRVVAQRVDTLQSFAMKTRRMLKGHQGKALSLDWSPDKRHLVSSSQDGKIIVWDGFSTNKEHALSLPTTWIMTTAFSPSTQYVAAGMSLAWEKNKGIAVLLWWTRRNVLLRVNISTPINFGSHRIVLFGREVKSA